MDEVYKISDHETATLTSGRFSHHLFSLRYSSIVHRWTYPQGPLNGCRTLNPHHAISSFAIALSTMFITTLLMSQKIKSTNIDEVTCRKRRDVSVK